MPPHVDTDTSLEAAVAIEEKVGRLQAMILEHIRDRGARGATDDELEIALRLQHQTVSARRRELVLKGLICDSGERRQTRSGCMAIVWVPGAGDAGEEIDEGPPVPTRVQARKVREDLFAMRKKAQASAGGFEFKHEDAAMALYRYLEHLAGDRGKKCPECGGPIGRTYNGMWCPRHGIVEVKS
jgi:hypothetical protein